MNNKEQYHKSIEEIGLKKTWDNILSFDFPNEYFLENHLGGLYEEGLALENKIIKKEMGKYYTPDDVAQVMAQYFLELPGDNWCDLCCGTGNLILKVLEEAGTEIAKEKLKEGKIYLYDIDKTAIDICVSIIKNRYGVEYVKNINIINQDCLDKELKFPKNSKIISNPPYGKNDNIDSFYNTKELYVAFLKKCLLEEIPTVIITSHSFLGGSTFKDIRKNMNKGGTIFSFDNVPGNIFNGKKFGIFNSNEVNSTRAAITILNPKEKGYLVSPFIRFKTEDRNKIINKDFLNSLLPKNFKQHIEPSEEIFYRIENNTKDLIEKWIYNKDLPKLNSLFTSSQTDYKITIPNTCRYFTVGSKKELARTGKYIFNCKNENDFYLAYAFVNSSLCYYYYRMCNGGTTYPKTLLKDMPIFGKLTQELKNLCIEMINKENEYLVIAKNSGKTQENIKFPEEYRHKINNLLLKQLNLEPNIGLNNIHLNSCLDYVQS